MDVTESLETLRKLLESQLRCSLDQFEFWLQDTMKVAFVFSSCYSVDEYHQCFDAVVAVLVMAALQFLG